MNRVSLNTFLHNPFLLSWFLLWYSTLARSKKVLFSSSRSVWSADRADAQKPGREGEAPRMRANGLRRKPIPALLAAPLLPSGGNSASAGKVAPPTWRQLSHTPVTRRKRDSASVIFRQILPRRGFFSSTPGQIDDISPESVLRDGCWRSGGMKRAVSASLPPSLPPSHVHLSCLRFPTLSSPLLLSCAPPAPAQNHHGRAVCSHGRQRGPPPWFLTQANHAWWIWSIKPIWRRAATWKGAARQEAIGSPLFNHP